MKLTFLQLISRSSARPLVGASIRRFVGSSSRSSIRPYLHTSILLFLLCTAGTVRAQELLTLREAVDLALANNYAIRIARNEIDVARNNASPGNAGFLPALSLSAGYNGTLANTRQTFLDGRTTERDGAQTTRQAAGAALRWTLFDGLGRFATYNRLQTQYAQQRARARTTAENVLADVIVSYFDLARQQQQRRVLEEAVEISGERLRIAELRRDLGSASELEVRQARLDLNTDRAALLRQQTALVNAKAAFNQLLVRPLSLDYTVVDSVEIAMDIAVETLLAEAMAQNAALQVAEQERAVAALTLREIRAERLPTIDLSAGLNYANLEAEAGFLLSNRSDDLTYGLTVNFDLFDGFNRRRRAQNAAVDIRNADLAIEDARTQIQTDVTRFFADYRNSLELIALERENLGLARQNVEIGLERFRLGTITSVELREVQETLTRAQSRLLTAQFEAKRAETELLRLSGRLAGA